jgi:ATP-dependent DNA ligase
MEALSVDAIPQGEEWQYEPKWDGFRCLLFATGTKLSSNSRIYLSPATPSPAQAKDWLAKASVTFDGIIAKHRDLNYRSGERDGMQKIKSFRSADCVVAGFRYGKGKKTVGSLPLVSTKRTVCCITLALPRASPPPTARL